jgi:hypothetical protein
MDVFEEAAWLRAFPAFQERPATITEFMTSKYLNIEHGVRDGVMEALIEIFGKEVTGLRLSRVRRAMFTGAIGIGKTTFASIALPYMSHYVLCMKNPQKYYDLLDGSRIAFMQMSTSADQAKEVLFGDIFARIQHSPWFRENYPYDPKYKNQIRFPQKDIWIIPGDSAETTFEGYNILAGIIDEMDSHKVTKNKDYAEVGYDTIQSRIDSRFQDRGLIIAIGQMKKAIGFAARKREEMLKDPHAYVAQMSIWESLGWDKFLKPDGTHDSFWYDTKRKEIIPTLVVGMIENESLIEIPTVYIDNFKNSPEKALRDLAGIPPMVGDPFISLTSKIVDCVDKWQERFDNIGSPIGPENYHHTIQPWFRAPNTLKRVVHIDIAYSGEGDAAGLAMGHVPEVVEIDGERKPYIVFDCLVRFKASAGTEILLSDIRRFVYDLRDELGFKIVRATLDGFQSTDTIQQFNRRRIQTDYLSIDRNVLPYHDLREAIYEGRLEFPPYITAVNVGDPKESWTQVAVRELEQLTDTGKKIDHPENGSKDLADCMAGVVCTLMGNASYRRGVVNMSSYAHNPDSLQATGTDGNGNGLANVLSLFPGGSVSAPVPSGFSGLSGLQIPAHLRPGGLR